MKTINILDKLFYYEIYEDCDQYGSCIETFFYSKIGTKSRKKFWFFGPIIQVEDNTIAFKVDFDIESTQITKSELRNILNHKVELLTRENEIERGELI